MRIAQDTLADILENVTRAASTRPTLPVLSHVIFDGEKAFCTDLEVWIFQDVPGLDFSACVPARLFADLVKTSTGMVDLELRGGTLIVSSGRQVSEIRTIAFEEAPMLPSMPDEWRGIDAAQFLRDIDRVAMCAAADESRPVLTGVLVSPTFTLSAADGFRLATTGFSGDGVIIPAKTMQLLPKLFNDAEAISQNFTDNQAAFRGNGVTVVSQIIEGNYPNVEQIIPKKHDAVLEFNSSEALFALKPIMVLAERDAPLVTVERRDDKIHLSTTSTDGEAESEFHAEGGNFDTFAINGKLLRDALQAMGKIEMKVTTPAAPILLEEDGYRHVIMPMHVR